MIELRTLGTLEVRAGDGRVLHTLVAQPKRIALLTYLCLARPRGFHRRDTLLGLFWPESDEQHARASLRNALHVLRRSLGDSAIISRGDEDVALDFSGLSCDALAFEEALASGRADEAVAQYQGDLLAGFYLEETPAFEQWLEGERSRLRGEAARAMQLESDRLAAMNNFPAAVELERRSFALSETDERALRRLITLLDRAGDRAAALKTFQEFSDRLSSEYSTEPSPETRQLVERVRAREESRFTDEAPAPAGMAGGGPVQHIDRAPSNRSGRRPLTLAVAILVAGLAVWGTMAARARGGDRLQPLIILPFSNLSGDSTQQAFVDAMHDGVINELGKIRKLHVRPRQFVLRFQSTRKSVPDIARELHVNAVFVGSVLRAGDSVRVTIELRRALPAETRLWGKTFRGNLPGVHALQATVARAIADHLRAAITPQELGRLTQTHQVNPAAYDAWVQGFRAFNESNPPALRRCIEHAKVAVALDPDYARAHALGALCYSNLTFFSQVRPQDALPHARSWADRAIEVDSMLSQPYIARGIALAAYERDWAGANTAFERAVELSSEAFGGQMLYAFFLAWMGKYDEAVSHAKRAEEINPVSAQAAQNVAVVLYLARRYDEAIAQARRTIEMAPDFGLAHDRLAHAYEAKRQYQDATREFRQAVRLMGDPRRKAFLARAAGLSGDTAEATRILKELQTLSKTSYVPPTAFAHVCIGLGKTEEALTWLEKGFDERDGDMVLLRSWPALDTLRAHPRFQRLLQRMNFPEV